MDWTTLLTGSAAGTIISEIVKYFRVRNRSKRAASGSMIDLNEIYNGCMKPVLDNTMVDRFLIWKVEDGGGRITPGAQLYNSVVYEDYRPPVESVLDEYQRLRVEKSTIEMLMSLCAQGSVSLVVEDLPIDNKLKTYYQRDNIVYAELYFIAQTPEKLFYCGIGTANKDNQHFDDPETRIEIDLAVNHLRNIFKKSIKYLK